VTAAGPFDARFGVIAPSEYDWRADFSALDPGEPYTEVDTGKTYGLAREYHALLATVASVVAHFEGSEEGCGDCIASTDEDPPLVSDGSTLERFGNIPYTATQYDLLGRAGFVSITREF